MFRAIDAYVNTQHLSYNLPDWPYRQCKTASQRPGFLCEDLATCLPPSLLCNGKLDCSHSEDESAAYCGEVDRESQQKNRHQQLIIKI